MAGGAWVLRLRFQCVLFDLGQVRNHGCTGAQVALKRSWYRDFSRSRRRGRRRRVVEVASSERHRPQTVTTQVAYFGWYQMHASKQSRNMKEYYEQNPTTGEQMGEGVAVPGSD